MTDQRKTVIAFCGHKAKESQTGVQPVYCTDCLIKDAKETEEPRVALESYFEGFDFKTIGRRYRGE